MLPEHRNLWQSSLGWCPSSEQQQQFEQLYQGILAGNRQLNLTRITEPEAFWEKHLWDSLRGLIPLKPEVGETSSVIDIGTGAGFPGLPCSIAFPLAKVTLLDSTGKKITYLNTLISQLELSQIKAIKGRAETVGQYRQHFERYDFVLLRAVASATVCVEYGFPFLKPGATAVLYRGRWSIEEQNALNTALNRLGGNIDRIEAFTTPLTHSQRHCVYVKKK